MLSPRPEPCPDYLLPVAGRLTQWLGPIIAPDQLPRFEISYRQGKTEYLDFFFGAADNGLAGGAAGRSGTVRSRSPWRKKWI